MSSQGISEYSTEVSSDDRKWYGRRKARQILQKVVLSADSAYATLVTKLPASHRRVWAQLHNGQTLAINAADTTGATTVVMSYVLTDVAPTSLTTNATTDILFQGSSSAAGLAGSVTANSKTRGQPANAAKEYNTSTSEQTLYLVPYAATTAASTAARYNVNTTAATSGYHFDSTCDVYVSLYIEEFTDSENV
jgi:hypothetical protein